MKKIQIGVMGSAGDMGYTEYAEKVAKEIGYCIAKSGNILVFGAEKDCSSLSTVAARAAREVGGLTVGVTYGKGMEIFDPQCADVVIATGLVRGGGRETSLVLSCDAIICIGGGSGTLNEMLVAYQARIPIFALRNTGGWSDKIGGEYLDERKTLKVELCESAKEVVDKVIKLFIR